MADIEEIYEEIDNLTRADHASLICARHRSSVLDNIKSLNELWQKRNLIFSNLTFSPDVEDQLLNLDNKVLQIIIKKLKGLDESVFKWRETRFGLPRWQSKITYESESVLRDKSLRDARRFRSVSGTDEFYLWHARFGSAGRIHFRIDESCYQIEVGYIGNKLPTVKFRT